MARGGRGTAAVGFRGAVLGIAVAALGCAGAEVAGPPQATRVEIRFATRQMDDASYDAVAVHALAVPQPHQTQVFLYRDRRAGCGDHDRHAASGVLFLPRAGAGVPGAKFLSPGGWSWAGAVPPIPGQAGIVAREEGGRLKGRASFHLALAEAGNDARMEGEFDAPICPPEGAEVAESPRDRTRLRLEVRGHPEGDWSEDIGMSIAWQSDEEVMVFLHRAGRVGCDDYRLLQKQGLFTLPPLPRRPDGLETATVRVNFVDPRSGWSAPVEASQMRRNRVVVSWRNGRLVGEIEVEATGLDPRTLREVYGGRPDLAERGRDTTWTLRGHFEAAVCGGEF